MDLATSLVRYYPAIAITREAIEDMPPSRKMVSLEGFPIPLRFVIQEADGWWEYVWIDMRNDLDDFPIMGGVVERLHPNGRIERGVPVLTSAMRVC